MSRRWICGKIFLGSCYFGGVKGVKGVKEVKDDTTKKSFNLVVACIF